MNGAGAPAPAPAPGGLDGRRAPAGRGFGLRGRIAATAVAVCAAVVALAGSAGYGLRAAGWHTERVRVAHEQLNANAELAAVANRYSEQIAELLVLGEEEMPDFLEARAQVEAAFIRLARLISADIARLEGRESEQRRETAERERVARQRGLYLRIDRAAERMLVLRADGRGGEAVALFREEIENRLDAELDRSLAEAIEDERREAAGADEAVARLIDHATAAVLLSAAVALAVASLGARSLRRNLAGRVSALAEGAETLGRGDFRHRVPADGRSGELGVLTARFNDMAARLEERHGRLARARDEAESEMRARAGELRDANTTLRQVDEARVRFLADLSHELRTPLTILGGEAEVALRGVADPATQRAALETVARQAVHMKRLLDDLLFLARSEAAEARFVAREVCLQDVLSEAVEEGAVLARRDAVQIQDGSWPEAPITVEADPHRLRQALLIALDNAVKYSPPNGVVSVGLDLSAGGDRAEVTVANAGPGLGPGEVARAFDRFFRGRNARMVRGGGTGLGLAIAKSIVERHGGTMALASAQEGPTELRIALPALAADGAEDADDAPGRGCPTDHEFRAVGA